jgi:hypothetical protein
MTDHAGTEKQPEKAQTAVSNTADRVEEAKSHGNRDAAATLLIHNVMDIQKDAAKEGGFKGLVHGVQEMAQLNNDLHQRHLLPGMDLIGFDDKTNSVIIKDANGTHQDDARRLKLDISPNDATPRERADGMASAYHAQMRVENKDGKDTYTFYTKDSEGKEHEVLKTDDVSHIDKTLEDARQKQIADIQERFGVKIVTDGSDKTHPPNFAELAGLQQALIQSEPAQMTHNGKPMEVKFHDEGDGIANRSSDGKTSVLNIYPDAERAADLAGVLRHEIAHNGDDESHKGDLGELQQQAFYGSIGYTKLENGDYAIRDKNNQMYVQLDKKDSFGDWTRVNAEGKPVDDAGNEVSDDKAVKLTNKEMRDNAAVRPPSDYFPKPAELQSDAFREYRGGTVKREELYANDPNLYRITAAEDQRQINEYHPPNANGSPSFIRLPTGELSPATDEAKKQIAAFNDALQHRTKGVGGLSKAEDVP